MKCKVFNASKELSEVKKELYSSKFTDKRAPCRLLQEFQNLIRKHFHSPLSSNPKWKELDKRNVDLIIFVSYILFYR